MQVRPGSETRRPLNTMRKIYVLRSRITSSDGVTLGHHYQTIPVQLDASVAYGGGIIVNAVARQSTSSESWTPTADWCESYLMGGCVSRKIHNLSEVSIAGKACAIHGVRAMHTVVDPLGLCMELKNDTAPEWHVERQACTHRAEKNYRLVRPDCEMSSKLDFSFSAANDLRHAHIKLYRRRCEVY